MDVRVMAVCDIYTIVVSIAIVVFGIIITTTTTIITPPPRPPPPVCGLYSASGPSLYPT
jgi:hypothetical protein